MLFLKHPCRESQWQRARSGVNRSRTIDERTTRFGLRWSRSSVLWSAGISHGTDDPTRGFVLVQEAEAGELSQVGEVVSEIFRLPSSPRKSAKRASFTVNRDREAIAFSRPVPAPIPNGEAEACADGNFLEAERKGGGRSTPLPCRGVSKAGISSQIRSESALTVDTAGAGRAPCVRRWHRVWH